MSDNKYAPFYLIGTSSDNPQPSPLKPPDTPTPTFDRSIKRGNNINFKTEFKISENFVIRFNKESFVPVAPDIYGVVTLSNNIGVIGEVWTSERPVFGVAGVVPLKNNIGVVGEATCVQYVEISGNITLPRFYVNGNVGIYRPYYVEGSITLTSKTFAYGSVKYTDDVFRGIKNQVEAVAGNVKGFVVRNHDSRWQPSVPIWNNIASYFDDAEKIYSLLTSSFDSAIPIYENTNVPFNYGIKVSDSAMSDWDDAIRMRYKRDIPFDDCEHVMPKTYISYYTDMIRLRNKFGSSFEDGILVLLNMLSDHQWAVPVYILKESWFQWCEKVVGKFVRSPVIPPDYVQPTNKDKNIRFKCPFRSKAGTGDYNIYFNMTRCKKPYVISEEGTYTVDNSILAKRVIDSQAFNPISIGIKTDIASWCWTASISIAAEDLQNVIKLGEELPLVELTINGDTYVFMIDEISRDRRFGSTTVYALSCRSISALLSADFSSPITYTNPTEISAVQLIKQIAADAVGNTLSVQWENLVSDIGWVLPANSVSISGLSPIEAIASIIKPVGGMILSHPSQPVIIIKKMYPYAHWETPLMIDHTLAEGVFIQEGTKWDKTPLKNGVYVTEPLTGDTAKVYRRGTAGEKLAPELVSPMLGTSESREAGGKNVLVQAAPSETKALSFPFLEPIHHLYPSDVLAITNEQGGSDWGTITNVDLNASVSDDLVKVAYAVSVKKFMETSLYV